MIINCTSPSIQGILRWTTAGVPFRPGFIWILANDLEEGVGSPLMTLELPSFWGLQSSAWNENNAHYFNFLLLQFCSLKQYEFFTLQLCRSEVWQRSSWTQVKVWTELLLEALWKDLFPGPFQLVPFSWSSSAPARGHQVLLPLLSLSGSLQPGKVVPSEGLLWSHWVTHLLQNTLPSSRSLTSIHMRSLFAMWGNTFMGSGY